MCRIAWDLRLTLHFDNPFLPTASNMTRSRPLTITEVQENPKLKSVESLPLSPPLSPDAAMTGRVLERKIDSPNMARIEHGLPIEVMHREQSGQVVSTEVVYPPDIVAGETIPPIERDITEEVMEQFNRIPKEPVDGPRT